MGLISDGYSKMKAYLEQKNAELNQAQDVAAAQDDWTTNDKGLRNLRRHVQKYRDKDEKTQLQEYLRQRMAQEDRGWTNPYGMLEDQEINLSRDRNNSIMEAQNFFELEEQGLPEVNILSSPNKFTRRDVAPQTIKNSRRKK